MTTPAINPHLTPTTYGDIKPGDRIVNGFLNPTHPNAHHLARPVADIVEIRRHIGWVRNWTLPRAERHARGAHNITHYDYETVIWRDTGGALFEDRADETVHIVPAA
jgi:hypothetical protein